MDGKRTVQAIAWTVAGCAVAFYLTGLMHRKYSRSADSVVYTYTFTAAKPTANPIQHVVVIMQENRSFDHLFNAFPGADTVQTGILHGKPVPLRPTPLGNGPDLDHTHTGWWQQWDNGKMDNFDAIGPAYTYIAPSEIAPYWTLARQYTLGDRMFQSNTGPSFVAHQYMIAGQSGKASENPSRQHLGLRRQAQRARPAPRPARHRPSRRLSLLRLQNHGRPARRQGHHLALLCTLGRRRHLLHALGLSSHPPHPLRRRLAPGRHQPRNLCPHRHRRRPSRAGHLGRPRLQQLRPSRRAAARSRLGRQHRQRHRPQPVLEQHHHLHRLG